MQLPTEPTILPQARRYTRRFDADRTKTFTQGDEIAIQIPPINHTYLTKDVRLHFDFSLTYNEMSTSEFAFIKDAYQTSITNPTTTQQGSLHAANDDFTILTSMTDPRNAVMKPYPCFDIQGPSCLFSSLRVYDYLGTTLLEGNDNYDLLTGMLVDFATDNEDDRRIEYSFPDGIVRSPGVPILSDGTSFKEFQNKPLNYNSTSGKLDSRTIACHCSIPLTSFLGTLSQKFVPLHNGFTLRFRVNTWSNAIKIDTTWKYNALRFNFGVSSAAAGSDYSAPYFVTNTATPSIVSASITNAYLATQVLEISPEFDQKFINTVLHTRMFIYQRDNWIATKEGSKTITKRLANNVKSLTRLYIGQRYDNSLSSRSSFRIKNGLTYAALLYNKAVVRDVQNDEEALTSLKAAMENAFDPTITWNDFVTDYPAIGFQGVIFPPQVYYPGHSSTYALLPKGYLPSWDLTTKARFQNSGTGTAPLYIIVDHAIPDSLKGEHHETQKQGKYLIVFDCRIPGATPLAVTGIDTTETVVEYKLVSSATTAVQTAIDVFTEHDAFIHVNPGQNTSVSF